MIPVLLIGLTAQTGKLSGLWELAQSAGWAPPHENICWISERHHLLARDDRGRLRSPTDPACAYPDGWAIYAAHGVRVLAYVIERPADISVERIHGERNAEVRRVMVERYRYGEEINGPAAFIRTPAVSVSTMMSVMPPCGAAMSPTTNPSS